MTVNYLVVQTQNLKKLFYKKNHNKKFKNKLKNNY
jgi:hypothetical protein